jgi:hypothetical protein
MLCFRTLQRRKSQASFKLFALNSRCHRRAGEASENRPTFAASRVDHAFVEGKYLKSSGRV